MTSQSTLHGRICFVLSQSVMIAETHLNVVLGDINILTPSVLFIVQ